MYKILAAIAAAGMLLAVSATAASAAPQRQDSGIHKPVAGEEFSSQRRYRRYYARRYVAPRAYGYRAYPNYGYSTYGYGYPYGYGNPYGYGYYAPRPFIGIGPFGIWW